MVLYVKFEKKNVSFKCVIPKHELNKKFSLIKMKSQNNLILVAINNELVIGIRIVLLNV